MTSPVDTSVKFFHSDMVGAPTLSGTAGALIALLDACLVNGFGSKSVTSLVVSGGVATLSFSSTTAAVVNSVVLVAGSSIAALNGEQKITAVRSGQIDFATDEADGTATGTITFKLAAPGWLKSFSGTNKAAYKSGSVAANGHYLRVDDSGTMSARVVAYETMTDVDTGTGPFPSSTQMSGGGYWCKSTAASAAAVPWFLAVDDRCLLFWAAPAVLLSSAWAGGGVRAFGDPIALRAGGDAFSTILNYSATSSSTAQIDGVLDNSTSITLQTASPKAYSGIGGSVLQASTAYTGTGASGSTATLGSFPSPIDGVMMLSKMYISSGASQPRRADVPGLHFVPHSGAGASFVFKDLVAGSGDLAGRTMFALPFAATSSFNANITGVSFVDVTGPWR